MRIFRGPRWEEGSFVEGWVGVEAGRIARVGQGAPPTREDVSGVLVPSLINAHTHVGDFALRGQIPHDITLEALVAPPSGLKHRLLGRTPSDVLAQGMGAARREARDAGTRLVYDFREGGPDGALLLRGAWPEAVILGRPVEALPVSHGLGLSAIRDVGLAEARRQRDAARAAGLRFALHWSEAEREPVEDLVELAPDFAVHAVHATDSDLAVLADAAIPLVACPRSNARLLQRLPDLRGWLDAGVRACLGTDNAMLQSVNLLEELRFARGAFPRVTPEELLGMVVDAPRAVLHSPGAMRAWREGEPADFIALAPAGSSPLAGIFAPHARVLAWGSE